MAKYKFRAGQLGLFAPESDWKFPTELPDLRRHKFVALDTENRDDGLARGKGPGWALGPMGYICGVAYATEDQANYIPIRHPETECFPLENVMRWVEDHHRSEARIIYHNGPYDTGWLGCHGVPHPVNVEDTLAGSVMLDENHRLYNLDACCLREGIPGKDTAMLADAVEAYGGDRRNPAAYIYLLPGRYAAPYATQDGRATLQLWHQIEGRLHAQGVWDAYRTEMDLVPMVVAMRRRGIRIDVDGAERTAREFREMSARYLREMGEEIPGLRRPVTLDEIRSPRQMSKWCDILGIRFPRTEKGAASFSKDWMAKGDAHPFARAYVQALKFEEAASKFVENFILGFCHRGRVHAEIHQFRTDEGGTRSHRFSYSEPPLQQMTSPDKDPRLDLPDEEGKPPGWGRGKGALMEDLAVGTKLRRLLLPERGQAWVANDYCHDDKTEVLTRRGWVLFSELTDIDEVAQQWPDGCIDFVIPTSRYVGESGERFMIRVRGARQMDFLVTDNHRMIVDGASVEAKDLRILLASQLPTPGIYRGDVSVAPALLRLVVAIQADAADRRTSWRFYLKKERKIERLISILDELGASYKIHPLAKGDQTSVVVQDLPPVRRYLSGNKTFVLSELLELRSDLREVFLDELEYWDGKVGTARGTGKTYGSTNLENSRVVTALASVTGYVSKQFPSYQQDSGRKPHTAVVLYKRGYAVDERVLAERTYYSGRVYCVTVPSHTILTRRNGRVLVSGQSQQEPRITVHFAHVCKISGVEEAVARYIADPRTDYHSMVADMTSLLRPRAKILNLAMTYGKGIRATAEELGVSLEEAEDLLRRYHERLPFIKPLDQLCKNAASRRGYIRLIDGARMHYPLWEGGYMKWEERQDAVARHKRLDPCDREEAERRQADPEHPWSRTRLRRADTRKALNNLVQGSAARQTKLAMLEMWRQGILPMIQMHDEVGTSAGSPDEVRRVRKIMIETTPLAVPIIVDSEVGLTWGDAKRDFEKYDWTRLAA